MTSAAPIRYRLISPGKDRPDQRFYPTRQAAIAAAKETPGAVVYALREEQVYPEVEHAR